MKRNMVVVYRFRVSNVGLMPRERNSYTDESERALPTYLPTYIPSYLLIYVPN
jgi:hypothetical protein